VANCQVTVNCHYAERTLAWPVATRLYLPQAWCTDVERCRAAQVPEPLTFQTKLEIGLALIDQATAWGVPHGCVVADAGYGDEPTFLNGLETRGERYVVGVRANFQVTSSRQANAVVMRADELLATLPRWQWQAIRWREGSHGWLRAKFIAVRGWRVDGDGHRHIGWLIGQRPTRGAGDWKYFWSNCPADMPLSRMVEYPHRRYWVEQFHEEAKGLLGWDQYQGRLWPGFHRNAVLVMLTYSFLVWLELRERDQVMRRGRPRGAFSPSTGSTSSLTRRNPSTRR
jgi:SRSO17 transposase